MYLGYLNIINATANYASGGKIDQSTAEYLNGVKAGKDLTLSNSTAMIVTVAGLIIQLKEGATPYEYIATTLGFLTSLGGLLCAIESGNIKSDPIFAALHEVYAELGQDQDIVGGAKKRLLPMEPRIDELYAAYKNPAKTEPIPVIRVEKPWYGPEIINYCFVDRDYGRQVAEDFIDETGIKGIWLSVRVRNEGLVPARVHVSFFYNIDDGPLQSIHDATVDKQKGDLLNPREVRDYWFQNWNLSRSEAADACRGKYRIIAAVALEGKYDAKKSMLQNSVKIRIPPYFQLKPISLSSDVMVRSKPTDKGEIPLIKEGEIITLSTKVKNLGGLFNHQRKLTVCWYIDDDEGNYRMIAKEEYDFREGKPLNYGDEINIDLTIDTTNLGFTPYTAKGWIRHFKVAIVKADFENFLGEEMPLFSDKQEAELRVAFDAWPPELQNPKLTLSNAAPTEGQTVICRCVFKNIGKGPVNLRNGTLKIEEFAGDHSTVLKTHSPRIEFREHNFERIPFDGGYSYDGTACKMMSFDFSPISDTWIDSIQIKPKVGTLNHVRCSKIRVIYAGFTISTLDARDDETGFHFLKAPIFLEEGKMYHFIFEGITGIPMIEARDFRVGSRDIIKNGVITIDSNRYLHAHPKFRLACLNTLPVNALSQGTIGQIPLSPGQSESLIEFGWDTTGRTETKFIGWSFSSSSQNIEVAETISVNIREGKMKAFHLLCEKPVKLMDRMRLLEFPIKIMKDKDVQNVQIKVSAMTAKEDKKKFKVYFRENPQEGSTPVNELNLNLKDGVPKEVSVGVAASKKVPVGTVSGFLIEASAKAGGQKIEKNLQLQFRVNSDFTEIFDIVCVDSRHELEKITETEYELMLYNNSGGNLPLNITVTSQPGKVEEWDYYFLPNRKRELVLELGRKPESLKLYAITVGSADATELRNVIAAHYNWDPLNSKDPDYSIEKQVNILTVVKESPSPLRLVFKAASNKADPGLTIKLFAQFTIPSSAEYVSYNISLNIEGNLGFLTRPPLIWQIERGVTKTVNWECKIPENATVGSTIPIKLTAKLAEDPRSVTALVDIRVTDYRKDYEFALKTDWTLLPLLPGKESTLAITIENTGRKADEVSLFITRALPIGGYLRPYKMNLSVNPDGIMTVPVTTYVPPNATSRDGGKITIKAVSNGNPTFVQTEYVIAKIIGDESEGRKLRKALF